MTVRFSLIIFALALFSWTTRAQVQKINTLAGNGAGAFYGDGANASGASLWGPTDVALDTNMNLYIVDFNNNRIRKVNTAGLITTVAGTGVPGNAGNGSIATSADIAPKCVAFDRRGNLFFSDPNNSIIRKVDRFGIISVYAGGGPSGTTIHYGYTGDGGKADTARFNGPLGIAVDDTGNLYIADAGNNVIRRIDTFKRISTFAGTGAAGYYGNAVPATTALLDSPYSVAVDRHHNVYINDYKNGVIRVVDTSKKITTVVGSPSFGGLQGYAGDGGIDTSARLNDARGICVDTAGNLYIADALNNVVRKVTHATGIITTAVGNGTPGFGGDLSYVNGCNLFNPYGVAVDIHGSIYIADANNERIRKTYSTTGVQPVAPLSGVSVFPNPAGDIVTLTGLRRTEKITLYDVTGRQVNEWQAGADGQESFSIAGLPSGIYTVHISGIEGDRSAVARMVKE